MHIAKAKNHKFLAKKRAPRNRGSFLYKKININIRLYSKLL